VCSDGLPPKPICSDTSGLARLRFTKWCLLSNERGWFDDSPESLAASKCWSLPSCSRSYVDPISTDQNPWAKAAESGDVVSRVLAKTDTFDQCRTSPNGLMLILRFWSRSVTHALTLLRWTIGVCAQLSLFRLYIDRSDHLYTSNRPTPLVCVQCCVRDPCVVGLRGRPASYDTPAPVRSNRAWGRETLWDNHPRLLYMNILLLMPWHEIVEFDGHRRHIFLARPRLRPARCRGNIVGWGAASVGEAASLNRVLEN